MASVPGVNSPSQGSASASASAGRLGSAGRLPSGQLSTATSSGGLRSPSRTSTVLKETAGVDESRNLLADLLCALRVCMTAVVEAVKACAEQQTSDAFLNLNLPAVRRAFPAGQQPPASAPSPAAAAEQQEGSPAAAAAAVGGGGGGGGDGFASFSSNRHSTILCNLVQQVAAFIPLPFNHDPLLLKWFDEHSELWQSLHSMNAPKASRSVQHGITDRKRMEAAQTLLQQALEAHNATVPRVLPPDASNDWSAFPPHVLGAPDASSVPIPSPAPAPSPPDKWRESKWGASPAEGGGFGGGAPSRPVSWAGAAAPPTAVASRRAHQTVGASRRSAIRVHERRRVASRRRAAAEAAAPAVPLACAARRPAPQPVTRRRRRARSSPPRRRAISRPRSSRRLTRPRRPVCGRRRAHARCGRGWSCSSTARRGATRGRCRRCTAGWRRTPTSASSRRTR